MLRLGIGSLLVSRCGIGAVDLYTRELCLSLAQHLRTFCKALTFTTVTHLSCPRRWAALGSGEEGRCGKIGCVLLLEQKAFSPGQHSCCVLAVSSNVPLLQEQWIAPATWKRTILAWMGWTMTCFTLMTLDLQVSLVR